MRRGRHLSGCASAAVLGGRRHVRLPDLYGFPIDLCILLTAWRFCSWFGFGIFRLSYPQRSAALVARPPPKSRTDQGFGVRVSDEGLCGTGTGFCERLVAAVFRDRRMIPCRSRRLRCRREAPARWSPAGPRETLAAARSQRRNETMVYTHVLNCGALWREESGGPAGSVRPCPVAAQPR